MINFFAGYASHHILPREEIVKATAELLLPETRYFDNDSNDKHPLVYGSNRGAAWVRDTIADFSNRVFRLPEERKMATRPEFLNLTSGASYGALNILLQTTLPHNNYTRQAFIVTPTYFLINDTFVDAGFAGKTTAVSEIDGNLDLEFLEERMKHFDSINSCDSEDASSLKMITNVGGYKKIYRYVIYIVPTYANPTGSVYSEQNRVALLELARKYDMLILSDDVYDLLTYDSKDEDCSIPKPPQYRFPHLDRETLPEGNEYGNTISNCTFSKIVAPGLRTGYQESVNEKLTFQLSSGGANVSGGTPSQLNSMIIATMIKSGIVDEIIAKLIKIFRERSEVLSQSIEKYLPKGTICPRCIGGYFTWCTLPPGYDSSEIVEIAKLEGLVLADGSLFEVKGDEKNWGKQCVRLCISFATSEEIKEGMRIWGQACKLYAAKVA
ncbi:LANO_0H25202g1_1 [Lachancea nothofagi CBS 11611]|uniref:LANO_0H25202g1_1 n=1 Tax=Lachancea nothofagi CBS 11611 TaxID=1266666 RepID=A0A1G4KP03_9SACH|nr:LANO_0H25202g1_1 [Lachancea nothofagi CBS 11611]